MSLLGQIKAQIKAAIKQITVNTDSLQKQDERMDRLERDLKAMQNEVSGLTGYERHQHGPPIQ